MLYNEKFGENVGKICIDGLFTCPNRDGHIASKGCIFCSDEGSGEHIYNYNFNNLTFCETKYRSYGFCFSDVDKVDIKSYIQNQIISYIEGYKGRRVNKYIAYFQNYSNTYDTIENLKFKYDSAILGHGYSDKIVGLDIATRPDCINEEICKLISSYSNTHYVCVELGFQTANDDTAKVINRGYLKEAFMSAIKLLNKYNIDVIVHIMIGLPNEGMEDLRSTIDFLSNCNYQGIKIHSTYVSKNTVLEKMYVNDKYMPMTFDYYLDALEYVITNIPPHIVIHRITGDCPKDKLIAPKWSANKKLVLNGLFKKLSSP